MMSNIFYSVGGFVALEKKKKNQYNKEMDLRIYWYMIGTLMTYHLTYDWGSRLFIFIYLSMKISNILSGFFEEDYYILYKSIVYKTIKDISRLTRSQLGFIKGTISRLTLSQLGCCKIVTSN